MRTNGFDGSVYFRLLAAVAAADGEISDTEVERFRKLLELAEADPSVARALCREAVGRRNAPLWFLDGTKSYNEDFARLVLRDAMTIAAVDGWNSPRELAVIQSAADKLGMAHLLDDLPSFQAARSAVGTQPILAATQPLPDPDDDPAVSEQVDQLKGLATQELGPDDDPSVYFRLLAAVAAADETVVESEVQTFEDLLRTFGAEPSYARHLCREAMMRRTQPLWFLEGRSVSAPFAQRMIRDAVLLGSADGSFDTVERDLLEEAADKMGLWGFKIRQADDVLGAAVAPEGAEDIEEELDTLDKVLAGATGAGVLAGGTWVLVGGGAAKIAAGVALAVGTGFGGWLVPLVLLIGAGAASVVMQVLRITMSQRKKKNTSG